MANRERVWQQKKQEEKENEPDQNRTQASTPVRSKVRMFEERARNLKAATPKWKRCSGGQGRQPSPLQEA